VGAARAVPIPVAGSEAAATQPNLNRMLHGPRIGGNQRGEHYRQIRINRSIAFSVRGAKGQRQRPGMVVRHDPNRLPVAFKSGDRNDRSTLPDAMCPAAEYCWTCRHDIASPRVMKAVSVGRAIPMGMPPTLRGSRQTRRTIR
jgi:hypothetical protein